VKRLKGLRTILVMAIAGIPAALDILMPILLLPEWRGVIPSEYLPHYTLAVAILGVVMRTITTTPVGRKE